MKGSHNTMTYQKPTNLLGILLKWTAKCQSKNLKEQYQSGVRYFDIRLYVSKNYVKFAHGLVNYGSFYDSEVLNILAKKGVKFRLILEKGDKKKFKKIVDGLLDNGWGDQIHYIVDDKKSWNVIWKNPNISLITKDYYPTYPKDGTIPYPKKHNEKYNIVFNDWERDKNKVVLYDFV